MREEPPMQRLVKQLFLASSTALVFYLRKHMERVTVYGNDLHGFLAVSSLQKSGLNPAILKPLCEKKVSYRISEEGEDVALLGRPFQKSSFTFSFSLLSDEEIDALAQHTSFSVERIEKELEGLVEGNEKAPEEDRLRSAFPQENRLWSSFSQELRDILDPWWFSPVFPCTLKSMEGGREYRVNETQFRWEKVGSLIALYEGDTFLFFTEKLIVCTATDPRPGDILVGDYLHGEDFAETGTHFYSGEVQDHHVQLLHENQNLWIRIRDRMFQVDPKLGLCQRKPNDRVLQQILHCFGTPEHALIVDPYSFALDCPRPFCTEPGIYHLHPFHVPKTDAGWVMTMILSLLIAKS